MLQLYSIMFFVIEVLQDNKSLSRVPVDINT